MKIHLSLTQVNVMQPARSSGHPSMLNASCHAILTLLIFTFILGTVFYMYALGSHSLLEQSYVQPPYEAKVQSTTDSLYILYISCTVLQDPSSCGVFSVSLLVTQGCADGQDYSPFNYEQMESGLFSAGNLVRAGTPYIKWFDFSAVVLIMCFNGRKRNISLPCLRR